MNIFITLDYELFFGENTGTVDKCIIEPTFRLLNILRPFNAKLSCFVDAGYLLALKKAKKDFPNLEQDYSKVVDQLRQMLNEGHKIELHVHPHWEDSYYDGKKWVIDIRRYKLSDFSENEILRIITDYTNVIKEIFGRKPQVFRAGGWSAQPFEQIAKALKANAILIDSTVFPRGVYKSKNQNFDFREVPMYLNEYNFSNNLTKENPNGEFKEVPISSHKVSFVFYWKFILNKTLRFKNHIGVGDGNPAASSKLEILKLLTKSSFSVVSIDGYKGKFLRLAFKNHTKRKNNKGNFMIIGHPKAFSNYSLKKTEEFIQNTYLEHNFITISDYYMNKDVF